MDIKEAVAWADDKYIYYRECRGKTTEAVIVLAYEVRRLQAELAGVREEIARLNDNECCCCGSPWKDHANGAQGHDFVSLFHYTLDSYKDRAEAAEDKLARVERMVELHLQTYADLNNNDDPAKHDALLAAMQQSYRDLRDYEEGVMTECTHGQLARSCNICELENDRDYWKGRYAEMVGAYEQQEKRYAELEKAAREEIAWDVERINELLVRAEATEADNAALRIEKDAALSERDEALKRLEHHRKAFINHIYISNDEFGRICEERSNAIDSSLTGFAAIRDAIRLLDNDATSFHNRVKTALKVLRKVCPDV